MSVELTIAPDHAAGVFRRADAWTTFRHAALVDRHERALDSFPLGIIGDRLPQPIARRSCGCVATGCHISMNRRRGL